MLLWFVGMSLVIVWRVFGDPAIDHRLVITGALAPDVVDVASGGMWVGHTLVASVVLLIAVMLLTRRRRQWRRRLLALSVGTFLHLLLDGIWSGTEPFWWPLAGSLPRGADLPSLSRPLALAVAMEAAGAVALTWWWRRFRLYEPERREVFFRTGRLSRDLTA